MPSVRTICLGPSCKKKPVNVMCTECWARVPVEIQAHVFSTWAPEESSTEHRKAIAEAVRSLYPSRAAPE